MTEWISVKDRLPEPTKTVLAYVSNRKCIIRAMWVTKNTINCDNWNFEEGAIYDEETDAYYWPQDWYEYNLNDDVHWAVSDVELITHWMPLPEPPNNGVEHETT